MNEDPKNEEIVIADHSSIEVQEIHNEIDDQTIIVANQEKVDVEKEEGWLLFLHIIFKKAVIK